MQISPPPATNGATAKARRWLGLAAFCACLSVAVAMAAIERGRAALEDFDAAGIASILGLHAVARAYSLDAQDALRGAATSRVGLESAGFALSEARNRAAAAWVAHKAALARASGPERALANEIDVLILRMEGALDQAVLILGRRDRAAVGAFIDGELRLRAIPLAIALDRAIELRRAHLGVVLTGARTMRLEFAVALGFLLLATGLFGLLAWRAMRGQIDRKLDALAESAAALAALPPPGRDSDTTSRLAQAIDVLRESRAARHEAKIAAAAAARAKGAFLSAMRHRVRTPLHALLGLIETNAAAGTPAGDRDALRTMRQTAEGLLAVVDDLFDFARIDAEALAVDPRATDAGDLLERVCVNLAGLADAKRLTLSCFVDPEIVERYKIDPLRVRQILFNLIGDAIARTTQHGVHARLSLSDGKLIFAVADSGAGVPQAALAAMLDSRGEPTASFDDAGRPGGAGPGLPVCRLLAARLGGRLRASVRDEGGTSFALELPAEPAGGALGASPAGDVLAGRRIAVLGETCPAHAAVAAYLIAAGATLVSDRRDADLCVALPGTHDFGSAPGKRLRLYSVPPDGGADDADVCATLLRRAAIVAGATRALGLAAVPLDEEDPATLPARQPPPRDVAQAQGMLILAVDDHPVSREVMVRQLEHLGYRVDAAASGAQAWAMWRAARYGLVIVELHMPDLDGRELTRRIRSAEIENERTRAPILALSATADTDEFVTCHEAGMDAVLAKPLAWRGLAEAVRRHLVAKDQ
jgi:signal transduction histidine kinase/CheY-like chemotaxis protein